jgi:chorismate dehydratase
LTGNAAPNRARVCAVSYLNTVPLVWGMLHGPQRGVFDLDFALPADCAERVRDGSADIGIVPVAALLEQDLKIFRGAGIACRGGVRSILLVSKVPLDRVRTLAVDSSSRSSTMLSRIVLDEAYGVRPEIRSMPPDLDPMLETADAAMIIGDPALRLDPPTLESAGLHVHDLGAEWVNLTGLPMVFAVWAGRADVWTHERERAFAGSARFGLEHVGDIVAAEHSARGISADLAREYLTEHIVTELGDDEYSGMEAYLKRAALIAEVEFEGISV